MVKMEKRQVKPAVKSVRVIRKCPYCGRTFYAKLTQCSGIIEIICCRCGKHVPMNLALRTVRVR